MVFPLYTFNEPFDLQELPFEKYHFLLLKPRSIVRLPVINTNFLVILIIQNNKAIKTDLNIISISHISCQ